MMKRPTARELVLLLGLALLAGLILRHDLVRAEQAKPQVFADFSSKLALDGYDPVAYFKTGKPQKGNHAAGIRAAVRRLLRVGRLAGLYRKGRSARLADRRGQALRQLQRVGAENLGEGHSGPYLQG
jgi:hypothetical protein